MKFKENFGLLKLKHSYQASNSTEKALEIPRTVTRRQMITKSYHIHILVPKALYDLKTVPDVEDIKHGMTCCELLVLFPHLNFICVSQ